MPAILTHYIAGKTVLENSSPQIREIIKQSEQLYNLGAQGPDIFFYYLPGLARKRSRGIGPQMHKNDLALFIAKMAKAAKSLKMTGGSSPPPHHIIFSYTAGIIMHYVVDINSHPYVYARTFNSTASKIKNSTNHHKFETSLDTIMLKMHNGKKPADYKLWELINAKKCHRVLVSAVASSAIQAVYNRPLSCTDVQKAMSYMVKFMKYLQSNKGRRKKLAAFVESATIRHTLHSSIIHDQEITDGIDYLNNDKKPWCPPWETANSVDSFMDRFNLAVEEGQQLIQDLYAYVYEDSSLENLRAKLGNRSLLTGMPCESGIVECK